MAINATAQVTKDSILTQAHANLYNLINNRSNVPDPIFPNDTSGTERKLVWMREPLVASRNEGSQPYPFVVVPRMQYVPGTESSSDARNAMRIWRNVIKIVSKDKRTDSAGIPSGAEQCNELADAVLTALKNVENRLTLWRLGMGDVKILAAEPSDEINDFGEHLLVYEIEVEYKGFGEVA